MQTVEKKTLECETKVEALKRLPKLGVQSFSTISKLMIIDELGSVTTSEFRDYSPGGCTSAKLCGLIRSGLLAKKDGAFHVTEKGRLILEQLTIIFNQ